MWGFGIVHLSDDGEGDGGGDNGGGGDLGLSTSVICSALSSLSHKQSYSASLATGSTHPKDAKSQFNLS